MRAELAAFCVQLRLDLLHRAQMPWARRLPRAIATGVVNDYHSTLGVRARQAVVACARTSSDPRLDIRYHSLYAERAQSAYSQPTDLHAIAQAA